MAHKRMFSKDITTSDAFREMPASSQALYFHLGMEADDDGFLDNYRGLMRSINASDDDLKILLGKRFLILFPSKVVVVKHWLINNTIRKDRYSETKHIEEKRALVVKENGAYTESPDGLPDGNQMATQYRIEEDSKVTALRATTYEIEEDTPTFDGVSGDSKSPRISGDKKKAYNELIAWSEEERGFKFPKTTISKQYRAFKVANQNGFTREHLMEKWEEMSTDKFWQKAGFDWMNVVQQLAIKPV